MRDLDAREALGRSAKRVMGAVELGVARRSRPAVEVGRREPMRRLEPARPKRLEVAREKDRLRLREARPAGRGDVEAEAPSGRLEVARILVHRPARSLADREEAGVGRPRACAHPPRHGEQRTAPGEQRPARSVIRRAPRGSDRRPRTSGATRMAARRSSSSATRRSSAAGTSSGSSNGTPASPTSSGDHRSPGRRRAGRSRAPRAARSSTGRCGSGRGRRRCGAARRRAPRAGSGPSVANSLERLVRTPGERQLVPLVVEILVEPREHVGALVRVVRPARRDHANAPAVERLARMRADGTARGRPCWR